MSYTHKPNSGTLFDNDRKVKDVHPDFKGSALIDGKEYWLSAWNNESARGNRISLAFELKKSLAATDKKLDSKPTPSRNGDNYSEEIPF